MTGKRSTLRVWALLLALFAGSVGTPAVDAQVRIPEEALFDFAELDQIMRVGEELEREHRWGEALTHYEEAIRKHAEISGFPATKITPVRKMIDPTTEKDA